LANQGDILGKPAVSIGRGLFFWVIAGRCDSLATSLDGPGIAAKDLNLTAEDGLISDRQANHLLDDQLLARPA